MKQIIKSGIVYSRPCNTRFEWVDEIQEAGKIIYWLHLETAGFASEAYVFDAHQDRRDNTLALAALHHQDICWPAWCGPLPQPEFESFDEFSRLDGFGGLRCR